MQAQFWLDKWNNQETGFHLESAHPLLQKYYPQIFNPNVGVFVPLCGKSSNLAFFAAKGSYTLGCELAEKAVKVFFSSLKITENKPAKVSALSKFQSYQLDNLEILVGDYFELQPEQLGACKTIYDRAALIALPESMRNGYVEHMRSLNKSCVSSSSCLNFLRAASVFSENMVNVRLYSPAVCVS